MPAPGAAAPAADGGDKVVAPAVPPDEMQSREAIESIDGFSAAEEVQHVRAAAHCDVRRQVDELFDLGILIRAGAAARCGACSKKLDVQAPLDCRRGRRQTGHAAADDCD